MSELLFDSNTREERALRLIKAYEIFLFQHKCINIVNAEWSKEFCNKYKSAINQTFKEEVKRGDLNE